MEYAEVYLLVESVADLGDNSLYIALLVTVGTMAISAMAGYAFARIRFPGQNALFV